MTGFCVQVVNREHLAFQAVPLQARFQLPTLAAAWVMPISTVTLTPETWLRMTHSVRVPRKADKSTNQTQFEVAAWDVQRGSHESAPYALTYEFLVEEGRW